VPDHVRDAVYAGTEGGMLKTSTGSEAKVSNITIPGGDDPIATTQQRFDAILKAGGADPADAKPGTSSNDEMTRSYSFPVNPDTPDDGKKSHTVVERLIAGKGTKPPTSEIHIRDPKGKLIVQFKIRAKDLP
jgi:hypothetical protein